MDQKNWTTIIQSESGWLDIKLTSLWEYRDLILLLVKRDFVSIYKQTVLGPLWHLLQPLINSLIFSFAFSFIGKISTQNIPSFLYYLSGVVPWAFFADCVIRTSGTFTTNSHLFGKVYFPRLAVPVAIIISNLIKFSIQLSLFLMIWIFFYLTPQSVIKPNALLLFIPVLLVVMAMIGSGIGLIIASVTVRYRDASNLVGFGTQFLMYMSPVIFPSTIWPEKVQWVVWANPMTPVIEIFRCGFLGTGTFNSPHLFYSIAVSMFIFFIGIISFSKVEKNFIDTI